MDIDNLSSDEIEVLQARLAKQLSRRRSEEREAFVSKVLLMASEAGFELSDVIEMLHGERKLDRAKYRHPTDGSLTWSGMGRKPRWLHELINNGQKLEDFEVDY